MSAELNNWRASSEYFDFRGHPISFHRTDDSDDVLLCLHGFPSSSFDFHKIWETLAAGRPLLAFDMIGYGLSEKPTELDYTTFLQVDLLEALLDHLKVRRVQILSHDYGNTITQELLARRTERGLGFEIASICFLNGALFPETHRPIFAQKLLIGPLGKLFGNLIPDAVFKKNLAKVFGPKTQPTEGELNDFLELFKNNGGKRIAHKLIRYMTERETYRERWVAALHSIDMPFRFINGLDDPVSGRHLVRRFREVVPEQTDIAELDGIGHFPHFEAPSAVIDALDGFFCKD